MSCRLDHVVLWVEDPLRSVEFLERVVGLEGVRVDEFRGGSAPFPSARISPDTLIDLMPRVAAPMVNAMTGSGGSAGHPVNHVCLAMSKQAFEALRLRLEQNGTTPTPFMQRSFGARGLAPQTFYVRDPDGNVFEARYYDE
jgi:catechol 2,3-dioxygenase-like lactoylglutathione lyase family enzyme